MAQKRKRGASSARNVDEKKLAAALDSVEGDRGFSSDEWGTDFQLDQEGAGEEEEEEEDDNDKYSEEELGEEGEEDTVGVKTMVDEEMEALEEQVRDLNNQQQSIMENLIRHRDEDALKGEAIKNQKVLWDKALEFRVMLGKPFSNSNKLPKESVKSLFCNSDEAIAQAYSDLIDASKQTLGCFMELQEVLLQQNPAIRDTDRGAGGEPRSSVSNEEGDEEWSQIRQMHARVAPFRNSAIDKWQRKTQVMTGAAAMKGKLHAFNQSISDQVTGYMRDPSRMISRMLLGRPSVKIFGEVPEKLGSTKENLPHDGNGLGDPELIDDAEFYQQLLKEFLESCNASEATMYAIKRSQPKKRKLVDRRASKSRKIRFHVHEKLVKFMAPVPMNLSATAETMVEALFGFGS